MFLLFLLNSSCIFVINSKTVYTPLLYHFYFLRKYMNQIPQNSRQLYLYHGTNTSRYALCKQQGFYYETTLDNPPYKTTVEPFLHSALLAGISASRKNGRKTKDHQPLLLAISKEKYWNVIKMNFLSTGKLASTRYEIHRKIALEDLIIIDSLQKLQEVCPSATEKERRKFEKYYL